MKRLMIFATLLIVLFAACSKNQVSTTQTGTTSTFPNKASEYIVNNYPDASVDYIMTLSNSAARYVAILNTTEELAFSSDGEFMGNGRMYHHGDSIPGDTVHCDSMPGWHHGHPGHGHPGHGGPGNGFGIPLDSIPATIVSYVTANYPGMNIIHANYDSICPEGKVITVMIGVVGTEPSKLFFDLSTTYLFKGNRFRYEDMPQLIKDYTTTNYAAYNVCPKGEKFTLPDNSLQFNVYIHLAGDRKCLRLKEDGTLVCIQ
jgi:hypothetical protein